MFSLAGKAENQAEKGEIYFENALFARTYIRILFPEKIIHPFTQRPFPIDFHKL